MPAPEYSPNGESFPSGSMDLKSIPAPLIIAPSSFVVRTISVSGLPSVYNCSRFASYFFPVQGIIATITRFSLGTLLYFGTRSIKVDDIMLIGDLQLER